MKRIYFALFLAALVTTSLTAQQGIHGPRVVSAANTIVNEYTDITANFTAAGSTSITVTNSALNANGRFSTNLQPGDLIMIIQIQGVVMRNQNNVGATDTTWGKIAVAGDYYSCGRYEFRQVASVPNATTINIDCGLRYDYILGAVDRQAMVVRVPRFTTLTINSGGVLTCDDWNGTTGGILAVEVSGNTVINAGGTIDATGKGFRGGSTVGDNNTQFGVNTVYSTNSFLGAEKGEGVAGYQSDYDAQHGGRYCKGAPVNGGGGGDGHNAGGGGGANGPNSTSGTAYWSGNGVPDLSGVGWTTAWNLEPPANTMSLRTNANSAGGGRGGYTFSDQNMDATTLAPGQATWGGDARNHQSCGLGGRPLDYSNGRLFLGGGGGAGDQNQGFGGNGGDGGGLIYLMVFGNISGSGLVSSNGLAGANAAGTPAVNSYSGRDGAGGGGAGGTIVLNAVGGVANTLTVNANGGNGGNQVMTAGALYFGAIVEAEGPGGGGGGGYISVSSGSPTRTVTGGNNGTTNSGSLTEFTPNGATKGCPGTNNATITNFNFTLNNITICTGNSITLTPTVTGTLPPGAVFNWYTVQTGGTPFFTGSSYTTPALFSTVTYYVGTCEGWWRIPVTITVGPAPVVTVSPSSSTICSGGSVSLTASGAVTYLWNPGSLTGATISVSPTITTTYTVTGTVSAGCTNTAQVTVTVNPTPTVTATTSSSTICNGSSATLTGTGATSYVWNPGNISGSPITVNPSATTTYTVTGTSLGCSSTAQVTVNVNPSPTVTATASAPTICSGSSTTLTGSGAVSYLWNPGALTGTSITVSPAITTTYTVTGTAANGCTNTSQVTVTVNPTPTVTATAASPTICSGSSTTLTGSGGSTYVWNPGNISGNPITVSPTLTTTYTVTGTAANGCTNTAQVTVTVNPSPTVTATASSPTICNGGSTTLTGTGGASYVWNPGNISGSPITVSPTITTTYTVTGTAANGCTSTAQVTVTVNPLPTITAAASSPTICNGGSTTLTGTGGTTYVWNPGNISGSPITVSPTTTTTYTVTGTGANGCTNTAQVTVTVNPLPTITAAASSPTICNGGSTTLTGTGGSTYVWNPGNISGNPITVSPTLTTTYTVTGTAASGCSSTAQVTVTVNPTPTVTATAAAPTICSGGSTTLTGTGGTTYVWNPGNISGNPITVSPTITTTYTVTGTGANGCTSTAQVTVTVNPTPTVTATAASPTICNGGSTTLTGTGAASYLWNPGNISGSPITVSPTTTTTYTVVGTAANTCTSTAQVTVTVNPTPTVTATSAAPAICVGGSTSLTGSGASTYVWNPGNISGSPITVSPVATTTYTVTGTAANGCTNTAQVTVTVNPIPVPTVSSTPSTICAGQSTTLTAGGGTNYTWNGGTLVNASGATQTDSPSATSTYSVVVSDANGCSDSTQVTVTVNPLPVATAGADQTICSGSPASLNAGGGGTYVWNGGTLVNASGAAQTVSPSTTTSYIVTVTDANSCSKNDTVTINVNALPVVSAGTDLSACPNSSIQLNVTGASSYVWLPATDLNNNTISNPVCSPTATITYTVTGTDANGCVNSDTITVTLSNNLTITAGADVTICPGDTATLNTSGGTVYNWTPASTLGTPSNASTTAFPLTTTTYTVQVTDANNCQGTDTVTVFVNPALSLTATGSSTICIGQSATISASASGGTGVYTYNWSNSLTGPGPHTVSPTVTTSYVVTVTDSIGCSAPTQTVTVTVNPPLNLSAAGGSSICNGSSASLTASGTGGDGTYTYTWQPGSLTGSAITVNPTVTTVYTVVVTDGCGTPADTASVTVTVNSNPVVTLQNQTNVLCPGDANGTATVSVSGGTGPFTYLWTPSSQNAATATGLAPGTYTATITDANGCTGTQTANITSNPGPTAVVSPDVTITAGASTSLTAAGGGTYLWSTGETSAVISVSPAVTTNYCVTVTNANGCTDSACVTVTVDNPCGEIFVPNAFSPDGSGKNDLECVYGNCIESMTFAIYDRWGEKVFESTDKTVCWDGTFRGQPMNTGVYAYSLEATLLTGDKVTKKGTISLIR